MSSNCLLLWKSEKSLQLLCLSNTSLWGGILLISCEPCVDPQKSLQFVSILGAGLLCGTALAITIPEGVGLLEESWRGEQTPSCQLITPNPRHPHALNVHLCLIVTL